VSERSDALLAAKSGVLLPSATRAMVALYRPHLAPLQLTHPQYLVLLALDDGRAHKSRDIARRVSLTDGTLSPILQRLKAMGHIAIERNARDRRESAVTLTSSGLALLPRLWEIGDTVRDQIGFSERDGREFRRLLAAVTDAAETANH
jgi:DNA-binding MarR family transcriptional regulator